MAKKKLDSRSKESKLSRSNKKRSKASPLKRPPVEIFKGDLSLDALTKLKGHLSLAIDFETGCGDPEHKGCDCALDATKGILRQVNLYTEGINKVFIVQVDRLIIHPANLVGLIQSTPMKISHYSGFEIRWALRQLSLLSTEGLWLCTRIASQILHRDGEKHSYRDTVKRYLNVELNKDSSIQQCGWDPNKELTKEQINYCIDDVIHLYPLVKKFKSYPNFPAFVWYRSCLEQQRFCSEEYKLPKLSKILGRM